MSRRKRASMREGPLSDLFRSTADDAPADPPEAPRYGRQDPAEAKKAAEDESAAPVDPVAEDDSASTPTASGDSPPTPPAGETLSADTASRELFDQAVEETEAAEPEMPQSSTESAPERLKRVFAEEPRPRRDAREDFSTANPRYGREEPAYEPPGSGEPHQPVIKVVGVGGAGVNAVNRMVDARIPGVADITVHIGD